MNKNTLLRKIVARLEEDLELYHKAARASHEEATHEQNKAENKYDTRGLEAAYLAGAQSRQAAETESVLLAFRQMAPRKFSPADPVDLTALVTVEAGSEVSRYFLAPKGGGLEIKMGRDEVFVLTPHSPLGQSLMGRKKGDTIQTGPEAKSATHRIVDVE